MQTALDTTTGRHNLPAMQRTVVHANFLKADAKEHIFLFTTKLFIEHFVLEAFLCLFISERI